MLKKVLMILAILFVVVASLIGYGIYRFFNQFGDPVNKEISDSYYYSRDNNAIIYSPMGNWFELGKNKMDVDMSSFEVVGRDYAKDKNNVYFKSRAIDFDIPSFQVKYHYVPMDKNHVYVMEDDLYYLSDTKEGFVILEGADPETYILLSYNFAKDKNAVFMNNQKITNVDHRTFEIINDYFSKDNDSIYFYQYQKPLKVVKGNPSKTDVISSSIIKDDQYVYWVVDGMK